MSRSVAIITMVVWTLPCLLITDGQAAAPTKYCRFQAGNTIAYGIVEGEQVHQLQGDLFGKWQETNTTYPLNEVSLLVPSQPKQVFAMAGNYKSHAGNGNTTKTITNIVKIVTDSKTGETTTTTSTTEMVRVAGDIPEKLRIPQPFFKSVSCLQRHEGNIVIPQGATAVHYEAEMVIVIGRKAANVSDRSALDYVLGVTCGNDVSARQWQTNDVQWWRAKGSDTFGPCGPFIVSGLNYDDLLLELRLNGKTVQHERTRHLIHDVATTVSFISRHVTLLPGDLIFTGTSGKTDKIGPGDVLEVELEGVGILRNKVVADQ